MMRLGDLDALSKKMKGTNRYFDIKFDIDEMPTIDPETLPIVKELRAENKKLTEALGDSFAIDLMNRLERAERERDAAIKELHGKCSVCKNYAPFHRRDKCLNCKWDNASPACLIEYQEDNWEWHGVEDENNS